MLKFLRCIRLKIIFAQHIDDIKFSYFIRISDKAHLYYS